MGHIAKFRVPPSVTLSKTGDDIRLVKNLNLSYFRFNFKE